MVPQSIDVRENIDLLVLESNPQRMGCGKKFDPSQDPLRVPQIFHILQANVPYERYSNQWAIKDFTSMWFYISELLQFSPVSCLLYHYIKLYRDKNID